MERSFHNTWFTAVKVTNPQCGVFEKVVGLSFTASGTKKPATLHHLNMNNYYERLKKWMETLATKKVSIVLLPEIDDMETADRIKLKAHDLVMQYGIRSVSMDDIAGALGMSKKTIYQYFSDKDELVEAVIKNVIEHNRDACIKDKATASDAIHEVFLAIEMMQEMFANMNPSIINDMEKFHPKAYALFHEHKYNFLHKVLKENIERGIAEELYRPDIDIEVLIKARLETMMLPFNQQVYPKNKFRLIDVEIALTEHFLFGLASAKGHKLIVKYQQERLKKYEHEKRK